MAANPEHQRLIDRLGRLCGIAPRYWDNFGVYRLTSEATYQALLTAMGVPWEDPAAAAREIQARRQLPWKELLPPVTMVFEDDPAPRIILALTSPEMEVPPGLLIQGEFREEGESWREWQIDPQHCKVVSRRGRDQEWRLRLAVPVPLGLSPGYYNLKVELNSAGHRQTSQTLLIVAPRRMYLPECLSNGRRLWGFNVPLYALKSEANWGLGNFSDLRRLNRWAGELGAAFVGVNPLHALTPGEAAPSPYYPLSRLHLNSLYLDIAAIPELAKCHESKRLLASTTLQAARERFQETPRVPYKDIHRLHRDILGLLFQAFLKWHGPPQAPQTSRGEDFARFVAEQGRNKQYGAYLALAEALHQPDWQQWPKEYRHPDSPQVAAFAKEHRQEVLFHQYVQWLAQAQLQDARQEAQDSGLLFSLYQDLALGAAPGGFDTWAYPGIFAPGVSLGAPPDAFSPKGQDWGLPPMLPEALRQTGYRLFRDTLRANCPPEGILRLDHVMSLFRLFWIPPGQEPAAGAYVYYPARELLGILALESRRQKTLIIGEDLGTVPPRVRRELAGAGAFSYRVFYFERHWEDGKFRAPLEYPTAAIATATTHDLPTLAGWWQGQDISLRQDLHLFAEEAQAEQELAARRQDRRQVVAALKNQRLLPPDYPEPGKIGEPCPEEVRFGILEYLAESRATLMEVRLEEVFGFSEQQNLPGTTREHPNWRQKIPLSLEAMQASPAPRRLAERLAGWRPRDIEEPFMSEAAPEAAIIYNLFPPLVGPIPKWEEHLERIAAMGFTWIYLNPISYPGYSGSLYAVKDYFKLNPLFCPASGQDPEAALRHFLKSAGRRGLKVMLDLVINHTAFDSPLTVQHPEWYLKDAQGKIKHPGAIDPADSRKVTVWGDLAELAYWPLPDPDGLLHFWDTVVSYYLGLGFLGFRADAAYKIPGWFWRRLIAEARSLNPQVQFVAETLGARLEECAQLFSAGFDFLYNSSKWWDFQSDWCLEQYRRFRQVAPSLSFPETHDTPRLAAETGGNLEAARQRYLFAAFFSAGLMMPMGYEYGFQKRLHVVKTRPEDWESPSYDLRDFIAQVNNMKRACPVLLEEGPQERLNPPGEPVVLLLKCRDQGPGRVLAVINTTRKFQKTMLKALGNWLGGPPEAWQELTPLAKPLRLTPTQEITLSPSDIRLFYNPVAPPGLIGKT